MECRHKGRIRWRQIGKNRALSEPIPVLECLECKAVYKITGFHYIYSLSPIKITWRNKKNDSNK